MSTSDQSESFPHKTMKDLAEAILAMTPEEQSRPVGIMDSEVGERDAWWGFFGEHEGWVYLTPQLPEEVYRKLIAEESEKQRRASEERRARQIEAVPEEMRRFLPLCQSIQTKSKTALSRA